MSDISKLDFNRKAYQNNLTFAEGAVRKCNKCHTVEDYIPGQVIYNLGEYPAAFSIKPTEYDYELIKSLAE